ncbi:hypothetical protein J3B02_003114 [Coemansia erecta]|nr:hypothetical protein J3B02_003114 [Coemansia erecta]
MPVLLKINLGNLSFLIARNLHAVVQDLADSFVYKVDQSRADDLVVFALFLQHCQAHGSAKAIQAVIEAFTKMFDIGNRSIYAAISHHDLDEEQSQLVLKSVFLLNSAYQAIVVPKPAAALFEASNRASLFAVFGGNPGTTSYLDKIKWMLDIYKPLIGEYAAQMSDFLQTESHDKMIFRAYPKGLCIYKWINNDVALPDNKYLVSSPVSIPLVGLVQLIQLMVLYKTLSISPGELASKFSGK